MNDLSRFGYPRLLSGEKTLIPDFTLPENYQKKLPEFYLKEYDKEISRYASETRQTLGFVEIDLTWDEKRGLTNIDFQPGNAASCDLEGNGFEPHNIDSPRQSLAITGILLEYLHYLNQIEIA